MRLLRFPRLLSRGTPLSITALFTCDWKQFIGNLANTDFCIYHLFFCWQIPPTLYKTFKIFTIMQHRPEWRRFSSGMIKIAFTLSETNLFITFAIKFGEGTKQLFSSVQLALKASTHSVSGNLYFELNLTHCKPINCMNAQIFFIISNNFIID